MVYLLGGEATEAKILTESCELYNLKTQETTELPSMKHKHTIPSACLLNNNVWVFSQHFI